MVLRGVPATNGSAPQWRLRTAPGTGAALAEVRCVCRDCGAHVHGIASTNTLGGSCPNCGSYQIAVDAG